MQLARDQCRLCLGECGRDVLIFRFAPTPRDSELIYREVVALPADPVIEMLHRISDRGEDLRPQYLSSKALKNNEGCLRALVVSGILGVKRWIGVQRPTSGRCATNRRFGFGGQRLMCHDVLDM